MTSSFDPAAFRRELDLVLERTRDPGLRDVVWSCIEGRLTRAELRRDGRYTAAAGELYRERFAQLEAAGVDLAGLRADVRRLAVEEDERNGTRVADLCTGPEWRPADRRA